MTVAQNPTLWALAGLLFNMAGAGLMFLAFSSASHAPANTDRSELWLEARAGAGLLLIGFFLQATGSAGSHTMDKAASILLLILALGLVFYVAAGRDLVAGMLTSKSAAAAADTRPQLITSDRTPPRQLDDVRQALAVGG